MEKKMSRHYGFIRNQETGECVARVENGKVTTADGISYSLVGDMIVAEDGTKLGYLGTFVGLTKGPDNLANRLFPR
jgi:hypothetical protein